MKAIIVALLVVAAISGSILSNVAIAPLPSIIRGTSSKIYLDGKANADFLFKFSMFHNSFTSELKVFCHVEPRMLVHGQLKLKSITRSQQTTKPDNMSWEFWRKPQKTGIGPTNQTTIMQKNSVKPFKVIAGDAPSTLKVGNSIKYSFQTENGKRDLIYALFGLSEGLIADRKKGRISGNIKQSSI